MEKIYPKKKLTLTCGLSPLGFTSFALVATLLIITYFSDAAFTKRMNDKIQNVQVINAQSYIQAGPSGHLEIVSSNIN